MAAVLTNWNSVAAPAPASAFLSAPAEGQVTNQVSQQVSFISKSLATRN